MELPLDLSLDLTTAVTVVCSLVAIWTLYRHLQLREEAAVDFNIDAPEACKPGWQGKTLDEPSIKTSGSTAIQCYAPATGQLLGLVNPTTPDGIDKVVQKTSRAQTQWAQTSFAQRRRVLKTLLKYVLSNQESIARAACLDSGKTRVDAIFGEILVTAEKLQWTIDHGEKALQTARRPANFLMFYKCNEVRYEPLGVVGACVSWKYVCLSFIYLQLS
jgi:acyl-CoA reductase-like NAD-dependent aldehyde dehydrogenase